MSDNKEKYDLYTEKISQSPSVKYRRLIRAGKYVFFTAVLSVIAGLCFGFAFRLAAGRINDANDNRQEVSIPQDEFPSREPHGQTDNGEEPVTCTTDAEISTELQTSDEDQEPVYIIQYRETEELLDEIMRSVTQVRTSSYKGDDYLASIWQEAVGSGLIIADNGVEYLILTEYGLCKNADTISIIFDEKYEVSANLLMGNGITDTAVVAVDIEDVPLSVREGLRIASIGNSYLVRQGQPVIAAGTLYGLSNSVEYGMAVNTSHIVYDADGRFGMIYTNMGSGYGNSGFLFNTDGEAIGVITDNYESNGNVVAYGISDLKKIIENMSNGKETGYLGVIGYDISEEDASINGIPAGAYVMRTETKSPAFFAGIQSGDIITKINDRNILNVYNISMALSEYRPDTKVVVTVYRKGKEGYVPIEFTVALSVK